MSKEICVAIENLPSELVTPEIAAAAIEEGNIKLLDCLPDRFLTSEVIIKIIEKNADSYSWRGFDLSNIPMDLRTEMVCEFAVKKSIENILYVPKHLRSETMLDRMLESTEKSLRYLHLFDANVWNTRLAAKGLKSVYRVCETRYGPRGGYHGYQVKCDIKRLQIFLSFIPNTIKTPEFFISLLQHNIQAADVNALLDDKYKDKAYYMLIAENDFDVIPPAFYDYDIFTSAISNRKLTLCGYRCTKDDDQTIKKALDSFMDDKLADLIVKTDPEAFRILPEEFKTADRFLVAVETTTSNRFGYGEQYEHLLSEEVCKAYVRKNMDMPKFPAKIWTREFADYCMQNGSSFYWFDQIPKELQTVEMVDAALKHYGGNIAYARPELISLEQAMNIYRNYEYHRKYIPQHYISDFKNETGLDEQYFGGERSFDSLREGRAENTYCKLGNTYVAIRREGYYRSGGLVLTVTRRTPRVFRPVPVFEREIGTFHTTWIEKMLADYDTSFVKPTVSKDLKQYQFNGYYDIEKVKVKSGITIYANVLYGERVYYCANIGDCRPLCNTLEDIEKKIEEYQQEKSNAA